MKVSVKCWSHCSVLLDFHYCFSVFKKGELLLKVNRRENQYAEAVSLCILLASLQFRTSSVESAIRIFLFTLTLLKHRYASI